MVIVDESKIHGTLNAKITITLVEEAKQLSYQLWGDAAGVEAERASRNEKALERYTQRCAALTASALPGEKLKLPARPKVQSTASWNFLALNQKIMQACGKAKLYGMHTGVLSSKFSLNCAPSALVTDKPEEFAAIYPHAQTFTNLFEALNGTDLMSEWLMSTNYDLCSLLFRRSRRSNDSHRQGVQLAFDGSILR
jgi:hypothetical protein